MKKVLIPYILLLVPLVMSGQKKLIFESISTEEGLSSGDIRCITQDKYGIIWIGTDEGLNRYDGNKVTVFRQGGLSSSGLRSSWINGLFNDHEGNLWIGTENGAYVYDIESGQISICDFDCDDRELLSRQRINTFLEDGNHTMWIGTSTGLVKLSEGRNSIEFFNIASGRDNKMSGSITCLALDKNGYLWLGSFDGVYKYDTRDNTSVWFKCGDRKNGQDNNYIESISMSVNGDNIYISSSYGFIIMDLDGTIIDKYDSSTSILKDDDVCCTAQYNEWELLIGTRRGTVIYDLRTKSFCNVAAVSGETDIDEECVRTMFVDNTGTIWMGTPHKVLKLSRDYKPIDIFPIRDKQMPHSINDLKRTPWGDIWLATDNGILCCTEDMKIKGAFGRRDGLKHEIIKRLFVDSSGSVWVGTNDGLQVYDRKSGKFLPVDNGDNLFKYVYDIKEDDKGRIIANIRDGICLVSRTEGGSSPTYSFEVHDFSRILSQSNSSIPYFDAGPHGTIWIGTLSDGIIRYESNNSYTVFNTGTGLPSNRIYSIHTDRTGNVWVGTDCGLCKISSDGTVSCFGSDPYLSKSIRTITSDQHDRLWIGLSNKILLYDFRRNEKIVCNLSERLGSRELIHNSLCMDNGMILMGGNGFALRFNPELIHMSRIAPDAIISSIDIINSKSEVESLYGTPGCKSIRLSYDSNNICLWFSIPYYVTPSAHTFQYQLQGYDEIWHTTTGGANFARYNNLSHGKYRFVVKGFNADGVACGNEGEMEIIIRPPWWKTPAAYVFYLLALLSVIVLVFALVRSRFKMHAKWEEEREKRQRMEDLNNLKLDFFTNISHEFKTPLSLIIAPTEALIDKTTDQDDLQKLNIIRQNSEKLIDLINQIMDLRRIETGRTELSLTCGDIVAYVRQIMDSFKAKMESRQISFELSSNVERLRLNFDSYKMEKIMYNLLSNAYKYTPDNGRVTVRVEILNGTPSKLKISVTDTGTGIQPDDLEHIFERFYQGRNSTVTSDNIKGSGVGLEIVKKYVELHKGEIRVDSEIGKGSVFSFTIDRELGREENPESIPELPDNHENEAPEKPKIVVIENDNDMLAFLKMSLESKYRVHTAMDGKTGLRLISDNWPDIIICDLMMSGINGLEVCKRVKSDYLTCHIPFIILTADTEESTQRKGYEAGADAFLTKPFSIKTLLTRIESILENRRSLQERYRNEYIGNKLNCTIESFDDNMLKELVGIVEDHLSDSEFGVQQLCDLSKYSYQQIYRKIRMLTGESLNEFIRGIRLKWAAHYLSQSDLRVSEIMYKVGFNSHSYFTKCFKKCFGMSPTEFVSKNKTTNNETDFKDAYVNGGARV